MKLIQFVLVPSLVIFVLVYFAYLRSRLVDRLIVSLLVLTGIVMILRPDWAQDLAQTLGVGRGADLVNYVGLIGLSFVCLLLLAGLRETQQRLTILQREIAIHHPKEPKKKT